MSTCRPFAVSCLSSHFSRPGQRSHQGAIIRLGDPAPALAVLVAPEAGPAVGLAVLVEGGREVALVGPVALVFRLLFAFFLLRPAAFFIRYHFTKHILLRI